MIRAAQLEHTGALIDDRFRLERLLGRGGMGSVWSARDLKLDRPIAIKFMSEACASDGQARERFRREARLASRICSPHVVRVLEQGEHDGVPYLFMTLLDGEDLGAYLAYRQRCSLVEAGHIVEQICRVLTSAHREGLIHRDIKPANIFLTPLAQNDDDEEVFVTLLDFGIAEAALDGFFARALQPDCSKRYPSADALGRAFLQIVRQHASSVRLKARALREIGMQHSAVVLRADTDPDLTPAGVRTYRGEGSHC